MFPMSTNTFSFSLLLECPDGLLCTSIIPSHYKRYSHFLLATGRAGEYLPEFSPADTDNSFFKPGASPSISCSAYNVGVSQDPNDSQNAGKLPKQCLLFPKQSSAAANAVDVTSKETCCLENAEESEQRILSLNGAQQFWCHSPLENPKSQQDSYQLNKRISENSLSDCNISYSPLNTDGEDALMTEEEEDVVEEEGLVAGEMKHCNKKLFAARSTEDKCGQTGTFSFHKPHSAPKLNQFDPSCVKTMQTCTINKESCKTLNTIDSVDGISNCASQDTEARRVFSLTNILDPLKESTENHSFPVKCKRTEKFERFKLSSSSLNTVECGWSSSNDYNWGCADPAAVVAMTPSEFKGGVAPFLPCHHDILKKSSSCLNREDKTVTGTPKSSLASNSLCSLTEKEGRFCNNTPMPVIHSPVSKMLPYASGANPQVQSTSAKELKQMDIGVFFGLPVKAKLERDQKKNLHESTKTPSPTATTGTRPRFQKRKAKGSVEDSDVVTESSSKNTMPADPASGRQRRWRKRFKESCPDEEKTRKKLCPFYKKIPGTVVSFLNFLVAQ